VTRGHYYSSRAASRGMRSELDVVGVHSPYAQTGTPVQGKVHAAAPWDDPLASFGAEAGAPAAPKIISPAAAAPAEAASSGELATTMVLRGAVGTLIGAAAAPRGREGIWGAAGFVLGVTLGQMGIVAIATVALWKKVER
jgi:hypothetical protein